MHFDGSNIFQEKGSISSKSSKDQTKILCIIYRNYNLSSRIMLL